MHGQSVQPICIFILKMCHCLVATFPMPLMLIFMLNFTPRYLIFLTNEIISKKKEVPWESGFTLKGNGEERAGR